MLSRRRFPPALAALVLLTSPARAQNWTRWASSTNGLVGGAFPSLAISSQGEIFYSIMYPAQGTSGRVWRASLNDPTRHFTLMPGFPLVPPASGSAYTNVTTLVVNANGEPIIGMYATASSSNTSPMLMTWDESAGQWFAPPINPPTAVCAHRIANMAVSANGDIWATCQWHGAYRSTNQGRTFDYVNVDAAMLAQHPAYFPTRAAGTNTLGALYGITTAPDDTVYLGTETGGVVYSSDYGMTWNPLDSDATNPMSTMARVTNSGDIAGVGVMPDGRILVQGGPGNGAYPPSNGKNFWVADRAHATVTTSDSFPAYYLGNQSVTHFAVLPSGEMFFHTGHNTVDSTGAPALGGIVTSTDGLNWSMFNTGISEASYVPATNTWVDGNGHGLTNPFAVDGNDLYTCTQRAEIWIHAGATPVDGGMPIDAGPVIDAGPIPDAGAVIEDAGVVIDAGHATDAGANVEDAGHLEDAGHIENAGRLEDAGHIEDAGLFLDAGTEPPVDAGGAPPDGGPLDSGIDVVDAGSTEPFDAGIFDNGTRTQASEANVSARVNGDGCRSSGTGDVNADFLLVLAIALAVRLRRRSIAR